MCSVNILTTTFLHFYIFSQDIGYPLWLKRVVTLIKANIFCIIKMAMSKALIEYIDICVSD